MEAEVGEIAANAGGIGVSALGMIGGSGLANARPAAVDGALSVRALAGGLRLPLGRCGLVRRGRWVAPNSEAHATSSMVARR